MSLFSKEIFIQKLKLARKYKKLSQKDVAGYLGLKREAYAKYEGGVSEPSLTNLYNLSIIYNVSLDAFLNPNIPIEEIFKYPKKNT